MLNPDECFADSLDMAEPLSLLLPTTNYNHRALIVSSDHEKFAVFIDGPPDFRFRFMECDNRWVGVHVPNVRIELDPSSIVFIDSQWPPLGSLTRHGGNLILQSSRLDNRMTGFGAALVIMSGLPEGDNHEKACFSRWQVVIGQGIEKRVLHSIDALTAPGPAS